MPGITLHGSCHCGAVKFSVDSSSAVPYQLCLCSICRKVGGVGGSINLGGYSETLNVQGGENISVYKAVLRDSSGSKEHKRIASSERNFCKKCSTMLWLYDPTWPELVHPFASAIDSPELEPPEEMTCIQLESKPAYVRLPDGPKVLYDKYGPESLESWHKKTGKWVE
ncbi:hypothetical protein FISHEDRAFT_66576 [Fistulina hepatica ATCC 64428]|uniref:CENP-V/GFA domain-containing protein n=1 Tax=Fistulina hepatica ATCC 64428 TaxID=1128425 RepID=A0A0D7A860_9AGAR|nr:hypothetical protein FISHEDRAFT_66576 [Fistulina hepatica ATCC 64428]